MARRAVSSRLTPCSKFLTDPSADFRLPWLAFLSTRRLCMSGFYMLYELYEKFTNSWEEASWLSFLPTPHMGIRFNSWNSNHYKETYIYMVLGEGIRPLQGRWAEKGLKGPGTLRPHNRQASCSHTASLCSSVCGSSGAWASPARAMCVILSLSSRGVRVECQFICAFSFSLAFLLYLWSPCELSRYLNWVIF